MIQRERTFHVLTIMIAVLLISSSAFGQDTVTIRGSILANGRVQELYLVPVSSSPGATLNRAVVRVDEGQSFVTSVAAGNYHVFVYPPCLDVREVRLEGGQERSVKLQLSDINSWMGLAPGTLVHTVVTGNLALGGIVSGQLFKLSLGYTRSSDTFAPGTLKSNELPRSISTGTGSLSITGSRIDKLFDKPYVGPTAFNSAPLSSYTPNLGGGVFFRGALSCNSVLR